MYVQTANKKEKNIEGTEIYLTNVFGAKSVKKTLKFHSIKLIFLAPSVLSTALTHSIPPCPARTIISVAAVVIHSMLLAEFLGSIKSNFLQT